MSVASTNALLERPRAMQVGLQKLRAVIRFNNDDVATAEMLADVLRCVSEIGEPCERTARRKQIAVKPRGESKTDRLLGVVWHGKTFDFEIAEPKARAGFERVPIG